MGGQGQVFPAAVAALSPELSLQTHGPRPPSRAGDRSWGPKMSFLPRASRGPGQRRPRQPAIKGHLALPGARASLRAASPRKVCSRHRGESGAPPAELRRRPPHGLGALARRDSAGAAGGGGAAPAGSGSPRVALARLLPRGPTGWKSGLLGSARLDLGPGPSLSPLSLSLSLSRGC